VLLPVDKVDFNPCTGDTTGYVSYFHLIAEAVPVSTRLCVFFTNIYEENIKEYTSV
jgi:hypothetical protein